jgi:hypothetical protein
MQAIQKDEVIEELFPAAISMGKAENQYSINMAIASHNTNIWPIYTPEAIDIILHM